MAPSQSFSDWNIIVNSKDTFSVHKNVLAVGPRSSEYFYSLFEEGGRFSESQESTSRIELAEPAATLFPSFLDYMYSVEDQNSFLTTETAVGLHWLAKYFDVRSLRDETVEFVKKNMTPESCGTYMEHGHCLNDTIIHQLASDFCSKNILKISPDSQLIRVPNAQLWLDIVRELSSNGTDAPDVQQGRQLSLLVAEFLRHNHKKISLSAFSELTSQDRLPQIHEKAALVLMDLERDTLQPDPPSVMTDLQQRCLASMAENWEVTAAEINSETFKTLLHRQSSVVVTALLLQSLAKAKTCNRRQKMKVFELSRTLSKCESDLSDAQQEIQSFERFHHSQVKGIRESSDGYAIFFKNAHWFTPTHDIYRKQRWDESLDWQRCYGNAYCLLIN